MLQHLLRNDERRRVTGIVSFGCWHDDQRSREGHLLSTRVQLADQRRCLSTSDELLPAGQGDHVRSVVRQCTEEAVQTVGGGRHRCCHRRSPGSPFGPPYLGRTTTYGCQAGVLLGV